MALPRRPYLLGLFPGTSNDWATQDRARGAQRERGDDRLKKAKEGRKKKRIYQKISCAQHKEFDQQRAEELEKDLAARLNRQHSIEKVTGSFLEPKQCWGPTEAGGEGDGVPLREQTCRQFLP